MIHLKLQANLNNSPTKTTIINNGKSVKMEEK